MEFRVCGRRRLLFLCPETVRSSSSGDAFTLFPLLVTLFGCEIARYESFGLSSKAALSYSAPIEAVGRFAVSFERSYDDNSFVVSDLSSVS